MQTPELEYQTSERFTSFHGPRNSTILANVVSGRVWQTRNKASNRSGMKCLSVNIHVSVDFWMLPDKFLRKKFEVPIVAYLRGLHECRAILSNSCASTHPAPVVLYPPNNFWPIRLSLREKMSHPIFAQHLRLEANAASMNLKIDNIHFASTHWDPVVLCPA